jgi:glycosyltransferase involved in cell wall biosynthesis
MTAIISKPRNEAAAIVSCAEPEKRSLELSIVLPCLNEAATLRACIEKARQALHDHCIEGEVVVADNGSTDLSVEIAERCGARVVHATARGYGSALIAGIGAARGTFVVMADADDSYDLSHIPRFLEKLRGGHDLVMGNRFLGGIARGAMPPLHRYVGNPLLSGIGRLLFASPCQDFHCGLRGFRREAIERLNLCAPGMEFASEMVVKATLHGLAIGEVPTTLSPDGRNRPPHLRSFRDGWRHLRFMLMFSPQWLLLYPGIALILIGIGTWTWGHSAVGGNRVAMPLFYAALMVVLGVQALLLFLLARLLGAAAGLPPPHTIWKRLFRYITLEAGFFIGAAFVLAGARQSHLISRRN